MKQNNDGNVKENDIKKMNNNRYAETGLDKKIKVCDNIQKL